jgi:hypothetical protein
MHVLKVCALCGWRPSGDLYSRKFSYSCTNNGIEGSVGVSHVCLRRKTWRLVACCLQFVLPLLVIGDLFRFWHSLRSVNYICPSAVSLSVTYYQHMVGLSDFYEIQYRGVFNTELSSESEFCANKPSDSCHLLTGLNKFVPLLSTVIVRWG